MLVVPTLHSAFLLRSSDDEKGEARFGHVVVDDLAKALTLRKRRPLWNEDVIWEQDETGRYVSCFPTADEVAAFCESGRGQLHAVDVEATGNQSMACKLLCVGLARADGRILCVPALAQHGVEYWSDEDKPRVWAALGALLADPNTPKVFHNGAFDTIVLWLHGLPVYGWEHDTMLGHHCVDAEMPHGLDFCASIYPVETRFWKEDVKGDVRWVDMDDWTLRSYNLRDCLITLKILPFILAEIDEWNVQELYAEALELASVFVRATVHGIEIDVTRRYWAYREFERQRAAALARLRQIAGEALMASLDRCERGQIWLKTDSRTGLATRVQPKADEDPACWAPPKSAKRFNPDSPQHLIWFLFSKLRFPVVKRGEKVDPRTGLGRPSTDKKAMALLAIHANTQEREEAMYALVRYRKTGKLISTGTGNFDDKPGLPTVLHDDGTYRLHATWKLLTVTGRLSSSPNVQNLVDLLKAFMRVGAGRSIVAVDESQAELRGIAYYSGDPDLLEAYERDLNVHTINTTLLFQVRSPGININAATEEYLQEACPRLLGMEYASFPVVGDEIAKPARDQYHDDAAFEAAVAERKRHVAQLWEDIRRLAKNFVFGDNYGAIADTIFELLRAQRDKKTDRQIFAHITLAVVEACKALWEQIHSSLPRYWRDILKTAQRDGFLRDPISGRVKRFRGGVKSTEANNWPIQTLVASHMNKATLRIQRRLDVEAPGALIILQVHDALYVDTPNEHIDVVKAILVEELGKRFKLVCLGRTYEEAVLPADKPKVGKYLTMEPERVERKAA